MLARKAFTLLEVLISILLMSFLVVALFSAVDMLNDSNQHLLKYLKKSKIISKSTKNLYLDIAGSDGNITIKKDEFSRICLNETINSLYGLSLSKVCWVVLKENNTLIRVEGNGYTLPLKSDDRVEVNIIMKNMELFDISHKKDKVLVIMKQKSKEPISFMVQGVSKPQPKVSKKKKKKADNRAGQIGLPMKRSR